MFLFCFFFLFAPPLVLSCHTLTASFSFRETVHSSRNFIASWLRSLNSRALCLTVAFTADVIEHAIFPHTRDLLTKPALHWHVGARRGFRALLGCGQREINSGHLDVLLWCIPPAVRNYNRGFRTTFAHLGGPAHVVLVVYKPL